MSEDRSVAPRSTRPPAVLIGGEHIALAAARSLGRAGVTVFALGHESDPVRHSRHCHRFVEVGSGASTQSVSLDWLRRHDAPGAVVFPCSDDALELIAYRHEELTELGYRPVESDCRVVLAMLDKERTYELADRIGIDRPRTVTIRTADDVERAVAALRFPCALKPVRSHLFARHYGLTQKALLPESADELRDSAALALSMELEMMVTEVVPGPDNAFHTYYSYLDDEGRPLFQFTKRKLRQWPIGFGLPSYHVSDWDLEVAELGLRFVREVGIRGLASVEFKRDAADGRLKLIECNHRLSGSTELLRLSGIDQALLAYERALGRAPSVASSYRTGVHMWHPFEDARAFAVHRRHGELSLADWLRSLAHRQHFKVFRLDDPMPSIAVNSQKVRRRLRRSVSGREGGSAAPAV